MIVVYVLNIVNALTYPKDKVNDLAFYDMLIKFVHIPFFLLIFGTGLLLLFVMVVPALIFFSPLMIMILAIINYLLMITSSMYGISAVVRLEQSGRLEKGKGLIYLVLHLAFVVDFLSAVSLYRRGFGESENKCLHIARRPLRIKLEYSNWGLCLC